MVARRAGRRDGLHLSASEAASSQWFARIPGSSITPPEGGHGRCSSDVHEEDVMKKDYLGNSVKDMKRLRLCVVRTGLKAGKPRLMRTIRG